MLATGNLYNFPLLEEIGNRSIGFIIAIAKPIFKMKLFNLLWLSVVGVVGASYLAQANPRQPQQQPQKNTLKPWKVQPVAMPVIDTRSAHQALLARQNQLAGKTFSCDCPSCRVAARQLGVTLN
jgi:hypothetical protein